METTATAPAKQVRKPRPNPERSVRLERSPTEEESGVLIITAGKQTFPYFIDPIASDYGRAFSLQKLDGTEYAVNLGDAENAASCGSTGHQRWGHRTVCKHLASLRALIERGLL
jgi:hypothetical protein